MFTCEFILPQQFWILLLSKVSYICYYKTHTLDPSNKKQPLKNPYKTPFDSHKETTTVYQIKWLIYLL